MNVRGSKARPLLFYVGALAVAIAMPPLLVSGLLAGRWVKAEQTRLHEQTHEFTEAALSKVDTFLAGKVAMLQALATSPALESGDFERLDRQARELLDLQGINIVLRDMTGQQIVNTRRPWGTPLPRIGSLEADRVVFATQRPFISDLYAGTVANAPLIRVIVPVLRNGRVAYSLTASVTPESLSLLLREAGIVWPRYGSIADRAGLTIARAEHEAAQIGTPLPGFDESPGLKGSWTGTNTAGTEVFGTYRRSALSGWMYTVGIDVAVLNRPIHRSIAILAGLAIVMGLTGFLASWQIVQAVLRSQALVGKAAVAVGSGEVVEAPYTPVSEANVIGEALSAASARLHDQATALTALNRDLEHRVAERTREVRAQSALLETTLNNMAQGLMVVDADGTVPICNQRALELLDLPAELMASRPTFDAVRRFQLEQDDFAPSGADFRTWVVTSGMEKTAHSYVRERPNGVVLEIRSVPLADGSVIRTYTDITVHREAERLAYRMARRDPVTGLANRTQFLEALEEQLAADVPGGLAVLCLDLDRFKSVNDTFGHFAGDALLREVANRISALASPTDTVARFAGDEFAVIRVSPGQESVEIFAKRLLGSLTETYILDDGIRVAIGTSIGVSLSPDDGEDTDELLKSADLALYRAKDEGRNTVRFFTPSMDVAARERRALELDLSQALARREFEVYFQPVIGLDRDQPCSFEALLRWKHPVRGFVPPAEFIPLAEDAKLIPQIGEWVLREACKEAAGWPESVGLAVNLSPVQFRAGNLVDTVVSALSAARLPASRLELEVTEAVLMEECDHVLSTLRRLRQLGVRIALDDFGTGYSSLSYLHRFPLDRIKIDRSFIKASADATSAAIVRTIIGLGNRLGTAITAEGVETREQLDFVRREGCHAAQGFLFSKPVPAPQARAFIHQRMGEAA